MAIYEYKILGKDGKEQKGTVEADNKEQATEQIKLNGMVVLNIQEQGAMNKEISLSIGKPVNAKDLSMFCKQFKSILNAGVGIIEALDMLASQVEKKGFAGAILHVKLSVEKGETLSNAMRKESKFFPPMLINMVEAGEMSGSLETSLERMSVQFEKDNKLKSQIKKAMTYPIVVVVVAIVVVIILLVGVIPNFVTMFEDMDAELPAITVGVMSASDFIVGNWYILLGIAIAAVFGIRYYKKTPSGTNFFARLALNMPLFSNLTKKTASARFARTLATLTGAGVSLMSALEITARVMGNSILENGIIHAKEQVERGVALSKPIKEMDMFPNMLVQMLKIGEETGAMEDMLDKVAEFYDEEVEVAVSQMTTMLEPLIIIILALIVGVIIAAVLSPMMAMYGAVENA